MAQPIWNTAAGSLGSFPAQIPLSYAFVATPVSPATSITYKFLSGKLPEGLSFSTSGILSGTPAIVSNDTTYTFSIRATDNLGSLRDRTFSITISGAAAPEFTTPEGSILNTLDSTWIEMSINYSNPDPNNPVYIEVKEGVLPPGLEINEVGILRGYAQPPVSYITSPAVETATTITTSSSNTFTCLSTTGFSVGRPIIFTGTVFGGVSAGTTYYIKEVLNSTTFSISTTQFGPVFTLSSGVGFMTTTLPSVSSGSPTIRTYTFVLKLYSPLGNDQAEYSITVVNQNTPVFSGGPGYLPNTRIPTILNTRPLAFNINQSDPDNFGYYIVPPPFSDQFTIPPGSTANMGRIENNNYFSFKILGHDFDDTTLTYEFFSLPFFLTGDTQTGWISGTPNFATESINQFSFSVRVYKTSNPAVKSLTFSFSLIVYTDIQGIITWITYNNLGTIFNGTVSTFKVLAQSDVALEYRIASGVLPPNLTLSSNGEIMGVVADQPTNSLLSVDDVTTFTFTAEAFSPIYPFVISSKQFTIDVLQRYDQPTDILYIKASPSLADREILDSLLENTSIIPQEALYRPDDIYFGKANNITYEHAYGIYASDINQYLAAVTENHYWRNITLGEIKTAIAKNQLGEVIYEVVYSEVVDNLVNPAGKSIPKTIIWPRPIPLDVGYTQTLHPNSLYNMRLEVGDVLGQEYDSSLLPSWMTSQQENGSTLGYTQAWVICYTKPGFSKIIANNIKNNWLDPVGRNYRLNQINFQIDRFTVNKSITYDYDSITDTWDSLPSATPSPNPINSEDFYVLFPRETILPK